MTDKDGGPAFPAVTPHITLSGMTLRDYFAGQALMGMFGGNGFVPIKDYKFESEKAGELYAEWGSLAYKIADTMLKARRNG